MRLIKKLTSQKALAAVSCSEVPPAATIDRPIYIYIYMLPHACSAIMTHLANGCCHGTVGLGLVALCGNGIIWFYIYVYIIIP